MTNREKYLIAIVVILLITATALMLGVIYFDKVSPTEVELEPIEEIYIEEEPEDDYDGPEIPELTPGDTIEEIEKDLDTLELEIDSQFEELEEEIEQEL